jgi:hypothetical protein
MCQQGIPPAMGRFDQLRSVQPAKFEYPYPHNDRVVTQRLTVFFLGVASGAILAIATAAINRWWAKTYFVAGPALPQVLWTYAVLGLAVSLVSLSQVPPLAVLGAGVSVLAALVAFHLGVAGSFLLSLASAPEAYLLGGLLLGVGAIRALSQR